jgi:hypothetical protein
MNERIALRLPFFLLLLAACGGHHPSQNGMNANMTALTAGRHSSVAPGTWFLAGSDPADYQNNGDPTGPSPDSLALQSSSAPDDQFGTVMTEVDPSSHLGKRLQLTATVRTANAADWAGLWMRVDGQNEQTLGFDNMENRPLTATSAAATYSVVLDVPAGAINLAYGVLLVGPGEATVSSLQVLEVDNSVPTTNLLPAPGFFLAGSAPDAYSVSGDPTAPSPGMTFQSSNAPADQFGTVMTTVDASAFLGKQAQLVASVGTSNVSGWTGLWMRVDDANGKTLAFDNMQDRPITGTLAPASYSVILNVDSSAASISYGVLQVGQGQTTVSSLTFAPH